MTTLASPIAPFASTGRPSSSSSRTRSQSPGWSSIASSDAADASIITPSRAMTGGLERISSHPSLTHSGSSLATRVSEHEAQAEKGLSESELITPLNQKAFSQHVNNVDEQTWVEERGRDQGTLTPSSAPGEMVPGNKGLKGGFTKSMHNLRGKSNGETPQMPRSRSGERIVSKSSIAPVHKPSTQTRPQAIPTTNARSTAPPSRPQPVRSGSSFSNFLRRLTGKSSKSSPPIEPATRPTPPSRAAAVRPNGASQPALSISTNQPAIPTQQPRTGASQHAHAAPVETAPIANVEAQRVKLDRPPVDPCTIPLPASPLLSSANLADEVVEDVRLERSDEPAIKPNEVKQAGLPRLEIPAINPTKQTTKEEVEEEEDDIISPLRSTRRISESSSDLSETQELWTPSSGNAELGTSATDSSLSQFGVSPVSILSSSARFGSDPTAVPSLLQPPKQIRVVSHSPPKKSPGATSPVEPTSDLGRKGSKWRKSMMNISETLKPEQKRISRAPPSSFDAYQAHQQRIANSRKSCSPTTHTAGSIYRDIQEIRDKEEREMAESFFMS